jgi:hypothetical protein
MKKIKVTTSQGHKVTSQAFLCLVPFGEASFALRASFALFCVLCLVIIYPPCAHAINAIGPGTRDEVINTTMNGLGAADQPTELEPIRIRAREIFRNDEFILARALHLYNQRKLSKATGDLKEILIQDPRNLAAGEYLTKIVSKINATQKTKEILEEELKGISCVESAQLGKIYGKEEFGNTDGEEKFTTNTSMISTRMSQKADDWTDKYISEAMRLEGSMNDYKYTATANINYYNKDNKRDDVRLRNATWWMKNDKLQFILGDTSSYLSRYVLNGVNYRGVNLKMNLYESTFKEVSDKITILYGQVPYFWLTEDEYIYPRQIVGVRNELDLWDWWDLNTSFAYILDNETRIDKIDTNNKAKENALLGIDQVFRLMPGIWTLYEETTLSYSDDDRTADDKILRSWANYFASDFKTKMVKVYTSYERINPNFRSYVGLTGYSANNQATINREHVLNFIQYTPYDEVDFGLQYSKTRTNLDKKYDTETIEDTNYKANLKIMPTNGLPRFSIRGSVWTSGSTPGAVDAPREESSWDTIFEMGKTLWETEFSTSYGLRGYSQFINETNTYGDAFEQSFTLSANKRFFEKMSLTPSYKYSWATLRKKPDRPIYTETISSHLFDVSVSSGLWDTAYLTFDYNFLTTEDFATPSAWGTNNAFTTTFSWPFTTTLGFRKKFVFSPYLSYHYSTGKATLFDRTYFAGRLEGDYFLTENSKLNLSGEYRDNTVSDPAYVGYGDEYRIMLSYKTVNGF